MDLGDDDYVRKYEVDYPSSDDEESEDEESSSSESDNSYVDDSDAGQKQSNVNMITTLKLAKKGHKMSIEDELEKSILMHV